MSSTGKPALDETRVSIRTKLALLWTALMCIYIYVDILSFYKPGTIEDILNGKVWEFEISQVWAISALVLMMIPTFMIVLTTILPARACRWTNIIVGGLQIPLAVGNSIGESWVYIIAGSGFEIILLVIIIVMAWKWQKTPRHLIKD